MDEKFREHIQAGRTKAAQFLPFVQGMVDVLKFSYTDDPLKTRDGTEYRSAAQRSIEQAMAVLEAAVHADATMPFVFFACMQDAQALLKQFAATRANDRPVETSPRLSRDQYQYQIQTKMDRAARSLNVLIRPAMAMSNAGGSRGMRGRELSFQIQQVGELVAQFLDTVNSGVDADEMLSVLNDIENLLRPIARQLSIDYDMI